MLRTLKKSIQNILGLLLYKTVGGIKLVYLLLGIIIAYSIITPPSNNTYIESPDKKFHAKLKTFFYISKNIPSYKVYFRRSGDLIWKNLFYSPSYTNYNADKAEIFWNDNSSKIFLKINTNLIWSSNQLQ